MRVGPCRRPDRCLRSCSTRWHPLLRSNWQNPAHSSPASGTAIQPNALILWRENPRAGRVLPPRAPPNPARISYPSHLPAGEPSRSRTIRGLTGTFAVPLRYRQMPARSIETDPPASIRALSHNPILPDPRAEPSRVFRQSVGATPLRALRKDRRALKPDRERPLRRRAKDCVAYRPLRSVFLTHPPMRSTIFPVQAALQ